MCVVLLHPLSADCCFRRSRSATDPNLITSIHRRRSSRKSETGDTGFDVKTATRVSSGRLRLSILVLLRFSGQK